MKIRTLIYLVCLYSFPFITAAQKPDTTGSAVLFEKIMAEINTKHVSWIKNSAKEVNEKNLPDTAVKIQATNYAVLGNINNADIEAMCFLVLMQAAKSAQEDLKATMAKVKSINEQKKEMRGAFEMMQKKNMGISRGQLDSFTLFLINKPATTNTLASRTIPVTNMELDNLKGNMKNDLDSMSEMGEMESMRLQMAMDRISKMMSTLSNLLQKISNTTEQITQNLK